MYRLTILALVAALLFACGGENDYPDHTSALSSTTASNAAVSSYAGTAYPPFPNGVTQSAAAVIPAPPQTAGNEPLGLTQYGFAEVSAGGRRMLWLSKITGHTPTGEALWQVVDSVDVSPLQSGQALMLTCQSGGMPGFAAIVPSTGGPQFTNGVRAWQADLQQQRITETPPAGVTCTAPEVAGSPVPAASSSPEDAAATSGSPAPRPSGSPSPTAVPSPGPRSDS